MESRSPISASKPLGCIAREAASATASSSDVEPAEADRIALAQQQRRRLVERQAHDVGIGADHLDDEAAGDALCGVGTGLAAPFAGGEIGLDVLVGEPLEPHLGLDQPMAVR